MEYGIAHTDVYGNITIMAIGYKCLDGAKRDKKFLESRDDYGDKSPFSIVTRQLTDWQPLDKPSLIM